MCRLINYTWVHPDGVLEEQKYQVFCERSVNGHLCSRTEEVPGGWGPVSPAQHTTSSSEEQQETSSSAAATSGSEETRRRKVVGWVRPARKKKNDDDSVQRVFIRSASLRYGPRRSSDEEYEETRSKRRNVWSSHIYLQNAGGVPPRAPSPPSAAPGFVDHGQYAVSSFT